MLSNDYIVGRGSCAEPPKVAKDSLNQLCGIFGHDHVSPTSESRSSPVLVATDVESTSNINGGFTVEPNCETGIAILDPKEMKRKLPEELFKTYNFAMGTYVDKASDKFHFGKTVAITSSELAQHVQNIIPADRNVMLVGHGVLNDLRALQALGFEFPTRFSAALDTSQVSQEVFEDWAGGLRDLLRTLECPYNWLHCAGNNANFTLKVLLLLVAKRLERQSGNRNTVDMLRRIGRQELPYWVDAQGKHQ